MPDKKPAHTPLRIAAYAVGLLLIASALLYLGATRTEMGRDALRAQFERQFAETFHGRVEFRTLTGNLRRQLVATDLRVLDAHGHQVMQVDSVVASPRWYDLIVRRFSVHRLYLVRPVLHLRYEEDGTWNVVHIFTRRKPARDSNNIWSFTSADVHIADGTIHGEVEGVPPKVVEAGWLFDPGGASLRGLHLRAAVEWEETRLVDLNSLSFSLPDLGFDVQRGRAQLVVDGLRLLINDVLLEAGSTVLRGRCSVDRRGESTVLEAVLAESWLDFDAIRRIVPRLPLADTAAVSFAVSGPRERLRVSEFHLARGRTRLGGSGAVGFAADSVGFDVQLSPSALFAADLRALLPDIGLPKTGIPDRLAIRGSFRGLREPAVFRTDADLEVRSPAGSIRGAASIHRMDDAPWRYSAELIADSLNPARLMPGIGIDGDLRGSVRVEGRGFSRGSAAAIFRGAFASSSLAGHPVDSLTVHAAVRDRRLETTLSAASGQQRLTLEAHVADDLDLVLRTWNLNVGPLLGIDSVGSDLTSTWSFEGSVDDGRLVVDIDSSRMRWGGDVRPIPSHRTVVTFRDGNRLEVSGDVLGGSLRSDADFAAWLHRAQPWARAFGQAARRRRATSDLPKLTAVDSIVFDIGFDVFRSDILTALVPVLPRVDTDLAARFRVQAAGRRLLASGRAIADSLVASGLRAEGIDIDFTLGAALDGLLERRVELTLEAGAKRIGRGDNALERAAFEAVAEDGLVRFALSGRQPEENEEARIAGTLEVLPDRDRLTLEEVRFALGGSVWRQQGPSEIDFFSDAVRFGGLRLEIPTARGLPARIHLQGNLSDAPDDTLFLSAAAIDLRQVSDLVGMRSGLGGFLSGRLALSGSERPVLTGSLVVDTLAFRDRAVGRLEANSRYLPGTPDIALAVRLIPTRADAANDVTLSGTLRLPSSGDAGLLDLDLVVERLDAFFVEFIAHQLADARGGFTGTGAVRGTFEDPHVRADLSLEGGSVALPGFGLRYAAEGDIRLDDEGIHIERLAVSDRAGGTADVRGSVLFNDYRFFSFDLEGRLHRLRIINVDSHTHDLPFYGTIQASGDATLTGPMDNTLLRSRNAVTTPQSRLFIPIRASDGTSDPGFILFADSTGQVPETGVPVRREHILARRGAGERTFVGGMDMDLDISAPPGSTVNLVIDPLLGDVISAVGSGRVQLQQQEGTFSTFGNFDVEAGDYLFTAGEVFVRRFLIDDGTITWTGESVNPRLDIQAAYRTRASRAGLPEDVGGTLKTSLPVIVHLDITGALNEVLVDLRLALDRSRQEAISDTPLLEAYLNQSDRAAQHATSVLVTNSFLLSTEGTSNAVLAGSAFNSVSALVSSQLNRYLGEVIPNADFTFGIQRDETAADLDVSAGIALRLLNERLLIRGQGIYTGLGEEVKDAEPRGIQGEFVVEIRLSPSVSMEIFYRREGDVLSETLITSETGAGLTYQTEFATWSSLFRTLLGRADSALDSR